MELNLASLFIIAGMAIMIAIKNQRIQYLKDERNHYKRVAEKLEEDIKNLTQGK